MKARVSRAMIDAGAAAPERALERPRRSAVLPLAGQVWWWVALTGQALFFIYLASFYAPATLSGHFAAWNRNPMLLKGYVAGQTAWNLSFAAHVTLAAVVSFGGVMQLAAPLRRRFPAVHRWNGRAFMLAASIAGASGLWMTWFGGASVGGGGVIGSLAVSLDAVLIFVFAGVAWRAARRRRFATHRRWALRLFMAANGVWFLRLGLFGWYVLTGGLGLTDTLDGPANYGLDFAAYLVPLGLLELYLRAQDSASVRLKRGAAVATLAGSAYMIVGIAVLAHSQRHLVPIFP